MIKVEPYSLKDLKRKFENREFAIPQIQRQFVWNKSKVCNLMDSIFRNFPIGIGLVWKAPFSKVIHLRPNHKTIIPPFNKRAKIFDVIIDGQQRLSVLYAILFGQEPKRDANSDINFKELFFNCDKKAGKRFVFSKRYDNDIRGFIKLYDILNSTPTALKNRLKLTKWETKEVEKCYYAFNKYKFHLLLFEDLHYNEVREVFIRINSAGMTVSRADTLFARASNINLRDYMLDTRRGLKNNYDSISIDALQNTLALAYGSKEIGGRGFDSFLRKIEKNKKDNPEFNKIWKRLQYGYEEAVDYLVKEFKLTSPKLLPSQNIYTMLSFFFFLNQSRVKPHQDKELKKWFWHTACGERYSGAAFNKNIPIDIKFFKKLAQNKYVKYPISEKINPLGYLKSSYKKSSSSTNSYYILLRTKEPLYLLNAKKILLDDVSSISNRKDRHHIYPKNLLTRNKIDSKWVNSISNICYLESDENQSFNNNHPKKYLERFKKKKHFGRVMKSHLIPYSTSSPIWSKSLKNGFIDFINLRNKIIIKAIEDSANAKVFEKLEPIKRL